jgi:diacylglycerol kinase family enzyme
VKNIKVGFLINPISGGGRGREIESFLPEIMDSFGYEPNEWEAQLTSPDDFVSQIKVMLLKCHRLIAVGGDGTVNAILNEVVILGHYDTQIGLIPLGTGNDLGRILNIFENFQNRGLLNTVRKLIKSEAKTFDLWQVNNKYTMAAYCSVGMDAAIAHHWNADRAEGRIPGQSVVVNQAWYLRVFLRDRHIALPKGSIIQTETIQSEKINLDVSGYKSVIIGNIGSYAAGTNPFFRSNFSDQILELVPVKSTWRYLGCFMSGMSKLFARLYSKNVVKNYKIRTMEMELPQGSYVQIDGEDRTEELQGQKISIKHAGQVEMLFLER